jgi:protein gp37
MADHTHIEWTDATWNPVTGCSVVSPGCANCYAMKLAGTRLRNHPSRAGLTQASKAGPVWNGQVRFNAQWLDQPLRWTRPRRIFVCAHGDLFHESVPDAWIDKVYAVMALAPQHSFQVLTKRSARMRAYLSDPEARERIYDLVCDRGVMEGLSVVLIAPGTDEALAPAGPRVFLGRWPLPNVWLGVSAEDQTRADQRIPDLLATPAAVRFVSLEPLLGPVDLRQSIYTDEVGITRRGYLRDAEDPDDYHYWGPKLDWVIVGGESGPDARPMHPAWARLARDDCAAAGVAFFFKQWGIWTPGENVCRTTGRVAVAVWDHDHWFQADENLAHGEGHVDDEPDLYRVGKTAAGRRLDGVEHNAMPGAA